MVNRQVDSNSFFLFFFSASTAEAFSRVNRWGLHLYRLLIDRNVKKISFFVDISQIIILIEDIKHLFEMQKDEFECLFRKLGSSKHIRS